MPPLGSVSAGDDVDMPAYIFDAPGVKGVKGRWSFQVYGTTWRTARVAGKVLGKTKVAGKPASNGAGVLWDVEFSDGVVMAVNDKDLQVLDAGRGRPASKAAPSPASKTAPAEAAYKDRERRDRGARAARRTGGKVAPLPARQGAPSPASKQRSPMSQEAPSLASKPVSSLVSEMAQSPASKVRPSGFVGKGKVQRDGDARAARRTGGAGRGRAAAAADARPSRPAGVSKERGDCLPSKVVGVPRRAPAKASAGASLEERYRAALAAAEHADRQRRAAEALLEQARAEADELEQRIMSTSAACGTCGGMLWRAAPVGTRGELRGGCMVCRGLACTTCHDVAESGTTGAMLVCVAAGCRRDLDAADAAYDEMAFENGWDRDAIGTVRPKSLVDRDVYVRGKLTAGP